MKRLNIIIDLDGTFFQTEYCVVNAVKRLFLELELDLPDKPAITQHIGKKTHHFLQGILPKSINPADIIDKYRNLERSRNA